MKKFILSSAVVAMMIPAAAFAQDADTQLNGTTGAPSAETGAMGTTGMGTAGTMETAPGTANSGGAMGAGEMSPTSDTTGSYTIVTQSSADQRTDTSSTETLNRNTDPAAVQSTIDANPGLAEKLAAEGVTVDRIAAISVGPNGVVTVSTMN